MKRLMLLTFAVALFAAAPVFAGHKHGKRYRHHGYPVVYQSYPVARVAPVVPVYWGQPDIAVIRGYYGPAYYEPIPAGYVMAPHRPLPPGILRRMRPFPVYVERRLAPLPYGYSRGFVGGRAVIYNRNTSVAIDIASIF